MLDKTTEPETLVWLGTTYKTVMSSAETNGAMSMVVSVTPAGNGPPRHIHDAEDEAFFVLDGEMEVWRDGQTRILRAGESVFIPRGVEHAFRNSGKVPSRHLVVLTPGGFEGFFAEMAAGQFRIPEDMASVIESGKRHSLRFTGPPL